MVRIKRRKNENKNIETDADIAKQIVSDYESVKSAIQVCLDFQKEKGIQLIDDKGKQEFVQMYRKYEQQNKVRQLVIDTVKEQIAPIDNKLNKLMELLQEDKNETKPKDKRQTEYDRRQTEYIEDEVDDIPEKK